MAGDGGGRALRRLHAAAGMARDSHLRAGLQVGRGDGGRDGDAALHRARLFADRDRGDFQAGRILRDRDWSARRRAGDRAARNRARPDTVRRAAIGGQSVLRAAGDRRPSAGLPGAVRGGGECDGRDGWCGAGRLSLEPVLAGFHRDSIRAAVVAGRGRAHAGGLVGRRARRAPGMGAVFSAHDRRDAAGAFAAGLDRAQGRCAIGPEDAFDRISRTLKTSVPGMAEACRPRCEPLPQQGVEAQADNPRG